MQTYVVMRRFHHNGRPQKIGSNIRLNPVNANRLLAGGYVYGPLKRPVTSKKRMKYAKPSK